MHDNISVLISGTKPKQFSENANNNTHDMIIFAKENGLIVNSTKTSHINFKLAHLAIERSPLTRINKSVIQENPKMRFFGIFIDKNLSWESDKTHLIKLLSSRMSSSFHLLIVQDLAAELLRSSCR